MTWLKFVFNLKHISHIQVSALHECLQFLALTALCCNTLLEETTTENHATFLLFPEITFQSNGLYHSEQLYYYSGTPLYRILIIWLSEIICNSDFCLGMIKEPIKMQKWISKTLAAQYPWQDSVILYKRAHFDWCI